MAYVRLDKKDRNICWEKPIKRATPQTLRRLTYFAAIADAGSIREAARRLGLSVASVSEALATLEDELGKTLATRNTRHLLITEEGRRVEKIALKILDAGESLFEDTNDPVSTEGHVFLTAPVEIAQTWLPEKLELFGKLCPQVEVSISASDLVINLAQSKYDLAIRANFQPPGKEDIGVTLPLACISAEPLHLEPCPDGWTVSETLLTHRDECFLEALDTADQTTKRIIFKTRVNVDNKHVALAMAARGMGAALVTKASVRGWTDLKECAPNLDFGHIRLKVEMRDKRPSQAARLISDFLFNPRVHAQLAQR